jgi:hypothetical protein
MQRYFGFSDFDDMVARFEEYGTSLSDENILFASYSEGDYEGSATVIFQHDGGLYEVGADHCSCNGLEGQWEPRPITWAALKMRVPNIEKGEAFTSHSDEARLAFLRMIDEH